jgi:hypothetical protein
MSVYLAFYILTVCMCVYDQNILIGLILVPVLLQRMQTICIWKINYFFEQVI